MSGEATSMLMAPPFIYLYILRYISRDAYRGKLSPNPFPLFRDNVER